MTDAPAPSKDVRIERVLSAPIETVWQMWTDPEHFSAWYGPTGATIPVAKMDVQVGGRRLISMAMETPDGPMEMWFTGEFLEVVENERLVYTDAMSDPDGNQLPPSAMGMPDDHPMTTEVIVELRDASPGTHMVMTHRGVPADSPGAQGWTMAIDKLEASLTA